MSGRRWPGRRGRFGGDRGSFTAELAVGLPALMLFLLAGLTTVGAVAAKNQCVSAAREGALVAARGGDGVAGAAGIAPDGAVIDISAGGETVTVTVRAPVPVLGGRLPAVSVHGTAVAAREPGESGAIP